MYRANISTDSSLTDDELVKLMNIDHTYPDPIDEDFQKDIYTKREFIVNRIPGREELKGDKDIKKYRDEVCAPSKFTLQPHQSFLSNFFNPDTPYDGLLVFHGTGTGKTCAAIAIAEKFKPMIQKYGTKIYVLVSGPLIKETWKKELIKCTRETYLQQQDMAIYQGTAEKNRAIKNAVNLALQYYKLMSYRSFYKKVLGEKVVEKIKTKDDKFKTVYRKTKTGEFERDIAIDRIYNLNNTLIIIDEAHNLTGNAYGEALMKIIKKSHNLKRLLLTATPMKNLADDVIELINFVRPINSPIRRDKIFNNYKNYLMDFKEGGLEYFKNRTRGYISYLKGGDPFTFAIRVDNGTVPKGLLFTRVIQCKMEPFQRNIYDKAVLDETDTLDRKSSAVANFAFPGLSQNNNKIVGYYGRMGINHVKNQLKTHYDILNNKIAQEILKDEEDIDLIHISDDGRTITGKILKQKYLKHFSIKFYKALLNLNRLVLGDKGPGIAFVYSNLVKVGIDMFKEVLMQNGYLEFDETGRNYKIKPDTRCYFCGFTYKEHQAEKLQKIAQLNRISDKDFTNHEFHPAAFISITGKSTDEAIDIVPEEKQRILNDIYSSIKNKTGRYIKFVLGSRVMSEAISLKHVSEVHILDVYFNLGKVDQVIGRAIRHCSHYNLMTEINKYPKVNVYKYAVTIDKGLSSEEELYKKAELKYMLIKKVERGLKEVAVDCPLNRHGNIFPEDLVKYKNCKNPTDKIGKNDVMCPGKCDYMSCNYKCDSKELNKLYWNEKRNMYNNVNIKDIDDSTFNLSIAKYEIDKAKSKIKDLYKINSIYTIVQILDHIKKSYKKELQKLFDDFFCFAALDELLPETENDFNNYKDTLYDKFNRPGYLIYVNGFYIFQPFSQNEDVPMYYRETHDKFERNPLTLSNYIKHTDRFKKIIKIKKKKDTLDTYKKIIYIFDEEYYDNIPEFKYVGIIDKELDRRKHQEDIQDVFRIRNKRSKILEKKRGTGIPSLKGAVCKTSKSKGLLKKIAKYIGLEYEKNDNKESLCIKIKNKLLFLEKYGTSKNKNKFTYIRIPKNHLFYPFPYNLEDRVEYIKNEINDKIKFGVNIKIKTIKQKIKKQNVYNYKIKIKHSSKLNDFAEFLKSLGGTKIKNTWIYNIR
uniref:DEAD/SNF2-like helicase n=1 Tax=Mimivirus LCMiAC02 TaxID=2506609 RepID=A0A481Z2Q6_9VIRU|nr:MAG: DEAD/SNF2-like helicase [Mimivirus LCMiAC02]